MATVESYETSGGKRYQVRYRTPKHKQTKKRGCRTKRDAQQFAASVEVQKYRGEYVSRQAGQATIGELGPGWLVRQSAPQAVIGAGARDRVGRPRRAALA